jgi:hypothetical protein
MATPTSAPASHIPPKDGSGVVPRRCQHRYVVLRSARWTDDSGSYNTHFIRLDTFFCEHCLDQKEVRKEEYSRDTPDWYRE